MLKELSLFIYGSFSEGMVHFNKISTFITEKERATIKGCAYRLPSGYPVVLVGDENEHADSIDGWHVKLEAPEVTFHILDEFHGVSRFAPEKSLFFRVPIQAINEFGIAKDCHIYSMNKAKLPKAAERIPNGDWQRNMAQNPIFADTLTDKQATYIKKLSLSTGRDIVPIDLELYRELMKLDLIVDKGRRLALSKLGLEVARYLPE